MRAVQVPVNQPVCHIVCHCPNGHTLTEGANQPRGDNTGEIDENNEMLEEELGVPKTAGMVGAMGFFGLILGIG